MAAEDVLIRLRTQGGRAVQSDLLATANATRAIGTSSTAAARGSGRLAAAGDRVNAAWRRARLAIAGVTIASGYLARNAVANGLRFNAAFQRSETSFATLLGTMRRGRAFMRDLQRVSDGTALRFTEVMDSAVKLLGAGVADSTTLRILDALNRAMIGSGRSVEEFRSAAVAIGQIQAKGKVSAEELLQLAEAGFAPYKVLRRELGLTAEEVADIGRSGIKSRRVIEALARGWSKEFGTAAERAKRNYDVQVAQIQKDWEKLQRVVARPLFVALNRDVFPFVQRTLKRTIRTVSDTLEREDLTFGQKARFIWRATKKDLDPVVDDIGEWLEREDVKGRIVRGIETWTPRVIDATAESMAKAAPKAAGAFIRGFRELGPWGKLLTVGFLATKMHAWGPVGRIASGLFTRTWAGQVLRDKVWSRVAGTIGGLVGKRIAADAAAGTALQLPLSMGARRGRFERVARRVGRWFGRAFGVAAAVAIGLSLSEAVKNMFPDLGRYSGSKGWANLWHDITPWDDEPLPPNQRPNAADQARANRGAPTRHPLAVEIVPGSGMTRFPRPRARGSRDLHVGVNLDGRQVGRAVVRNIDDEEQWGR